jgi:hypothetical protein
VPRSDLECPASLRAVARVGRTRRSATNAPEEWSSPPRKTQQGWDRTRLTRRLAVFLRWTDQRVKLG